MAPRPRFHPQSLPADETLNRVPPSICCRMGPRPPVTYGRNPAPCVPPIGMPSSRFAIRSISVLLPKSPDVPKKLGLYPKATSPPTAPALIPPAFTPNPPRLFEMLLPKLTPAHGFTKPSARATLGAQTSAAAADSTTALNKPRITMLLPGGRAAAADVPCCKRCARQTERPSISRVNQPSQKRLIRRCGFESLS